MATTPGTQGNGNLGDFFRQDAQPAPAAASGPALGLNAFFQQDAAPAAAPARSTAATDPSDPAGVQAFVKQMLPHAERIAQRLGVSADAVLGQWGLETGWGKSVIPGTNNFGNIKSTDGTGVAATDNATSSRDKYQQFADPGQFADRFASLLQNPRYKGALSSDPQTYFQGLKAGGYAQDPNYVKSGMAAARMAAAARAGMAEDDGEDTPAPAAAPTAAAQTPPPAAVGQPPAWGDLVANPAYATMSAADKKQARDDYFTRYIEPVAGDQASAYRTKFNSSADLWDKRVNPGLMDRAGALLGDARHAIREAAGTLPEQVAQDKAKEKNGSGVMEYMPSNTTPGREIPVTPEYRRAVTANWNSATPEVRAQMATAAGPRGYIARTLNAQHAAAPVPAGDPLGINGADTMTAAANAAYSTPTLDAMDPRWEARARQLVRNGTNGADADALARADAMRDTPLEPGSRAEASSFDFAARKKFNEDPFFSHPLVRGAVKGYEGYKQGLLGVNQFAAEMVGADASGQAQMGRESRGTTDAMGEPTDYTQRMFEGTISSIAQQIPALVGGAATGSEGLVLGSMFAQSFGQEYSDGRSRGQSKADATTRAGLYGAFEVIGEKFGLGDTLKGLRGAVSGMATKDVAATLSKALLKEIPGEELTTLGEFLTDKLPGGVGLNTQAGMADYLQQAGDTLVQTVMQGGVMGAGGTALAHGMNKMDTPARQIAREINRSVDSAQPTGADTAARAALDPNRNAVDPHDTTRTAADIGPANPAPGVTPQARSAVPAAIQDPAAPPAPPTAAAPVAPPAKPAKTAMAGFTETPDGFTAQIQGDDGQMHTLDSSTGINENAPDKAAVDEAAHIAATSPQNDTPQPTDAQKEAGNYAKGHISMHGLDISIENPQGSTRSGTSPDGKEWSSTLESHYGYIKRTVGADDEHIDTFIGPNPQSTKVFVVDQIDPATGKPDEHKVMLGFDSQQQADDAYHANYEKGWTGRGAITETSMDQFKGWLKDGKTKEPFAPQHAAEEAMQAKPAPPGNAPAPDTGVKPDVEVLIRRAMKEKELKPGGTRAENFRQGIIDAAAGKEPQRASNSYIEGHGWTLKQLSTAPKTEAEAKSRRVALTEEAKNVTPPPETVKTEAQGPAPAAEVAPKPKTEREAKQQRAAKAAQAAETADSQGSDFLKAQTRDDLKAKDARSKDKGVADKELADRERDAFTLSAPAGSVTGEAKAMSNSRQESMFGSQVADPVAASPAKATAPTAVELFEPENQYDQGNQAYTDPYENAKTRSNTVESQRQAGRDAITSLARLVARIAVVAGDVRSSGAILGNRMLANFVSGKANQLVGQVVTGPADLAILAQVYRDPRFETFRVVYTAGDTVVGEAGYTSRLPAMVSLPSHLPTLIGADKARFGADGFFVMHNHPSGKSSPSIADINLTRAVEAGVIGLRGHVVIDHNEYSVIKPDGTFEEISAPHLNGTDFTGAPELEHKLLGYEAKSPAAVAMLAKTLQIKSGHATLVLTKREGAVQLLVDIPMAALTDRSRTGMMKAKALIRRMARDTGSGGNRFLVLPTGETVGVYKLWLAEGIFTDVVNADGESLREKGAYHSGDFLDRGAKSMEVRSADAGYDIPAHDASTNLMQAGPIARLDEPKRVATLAKLKSLQNRRVAGKLTAAEFQLGVAELVNQLQDRNDSKTPAPRERGEPWVRERLMRAKRTGELDGHTVDFALWALDKNPALAADLAISLRAASAKGTAGSYQSAGRLMTLFKSGGNTTTAVHEILHHTERMMPAAIQKGIAREWFKAYMAEWEKSDQKTRDALEALMTGSAGNAEAFSRALDAFKDGTLDYGKHYQLSNASEFWAVNATDIMAKRYAATGSWVEQAKQWMSEMLEHVKGMLGLRSDAPVLKALRGVLKGDGTRLSPSMLSQLGLVDDIPAGAMQADSASERQDTGTGLTPTEQGLGRRLQAQVQDNLNRVKQVQERIAEVAGAPVSEKADAYAAEMVRPGRIAARLEDARDKLTGPLMERIAQAGKTPEQVSELLHAMHAKERNAAVAEINPKFDPKSKEYGGIQGSGMSDADAHAILQKYKGDTELHALADQARDISKETLELKLAYGLITADDHARLAKSYDNYVPLKGDGEFGPKVKRAMGHEARDEHVLENIARDYDQAVTVGEKNLARQSLLQMVLQHPDDALWTARVPPKGRYVAGKVFNIVHNGQTVGSFTAQSQVSAFLEAKGAQAVNYEVLSSSGERVAEFTKQLQDNEIMVYVKGSPVRIQIFDEKLAAQLRPLNQNQMGPIVNFLRKTNRYFSMIYTGYNPAFILRNMTRDAVTGTVNMLGNEGAATAAKALAGYPKAFAAMGKWAATKQIPAGKMGDYLREYRSHGGKVGASWLSDLEAQGKTLARMYDDAHGARGYLADGKAGKAAWIASRKIVGGMAHVVEVANQAAENALRLSLYATLRDQGATTQRAAQAAKSVTVDFDRKGASTGALGAFYLFFNPAVQGTANAIKTLAKGAHKEQAWAALGGLAMLGFYAAAAGLDDDKDRWLGEQWDTRTKNLILGAGDHQFRFPMSQEFAPAYAFGVAMAEASRGESKMKTAARLVSSFIDAYFPLHVVKADSNDPGKDALMGMVPTIGLPAVQVILNRSTFGNPLMPESEQTKDRPDNLKMFRGTKNTAYDGAAQGIADFGVWAGLAGKYENDITKVSPETLKMLWRTYTGGLGTFVTDSIGVAAMAGKDVSQVETSDIPIIKDFYRKNTAHPIEGRFYDLADDAKNAIAEFESAKKMRDGAAVGEIVADNDKFRAIATATMVRKINKAQGDMKDQAVTINADKSMSDPAKREALKKLEVEQEALYRRGIEAFK
jgi:hypothetical protein